MKKNYHDIPCDASFYMRLPKEELDEWRDEAKRAGTTLSKYVRRCVLESRVEINIAAQIDIEPLVKIAAEYGKIGSNINQIAKHLNSGLRFSGSLYNRLSDSVEQMNDVTRRLAEEVEKVNGNYKAQSIQKFKL